MKPDEPVAHDELVCGIIPEMDCQDCRRERAREEESRLAMGRELQQLAAEQEASKEATEAQEGNHIHLKWW